MGGIAWTKWFRIFSYCTCIVNLMIIFKCHIMDLSFIYGFSFTFLQYIFWADISIDRLLKVSTNVKFCDVHSHLYLSSYICLFSTQSIVSYVKNSQNYWQHRDIVPGKLKHMSRCCKQLDSKKPMNYILKISKLFCR